LLIQNGRERIAYSGDTGWFDRLPLSVAGSQLFICECTYYSFPFEYHLNHQLLVSRRELFDVGRIVITHLGAEMVRHRQDSAFETADDGTVVRI
jgi:ribonuclease BN (tRNA processing enzyme)